MSATLSKSSCGSLRAPDASVDTCPRTAPDSRHRHRRLLPSSTHAIREPTLGLPGAAPDGCNNVRRSLCTGPWGPRGRGSAHPKVGRHQTATSSGQQLPKECRPSSDPARCPCRPLGPPATVTPGRFLVSPVSPQKGRTDWLLSPSATTRRPAPGGRWWWWWWGRRRGGGGRGGGGTGGEKVFVVAQVFFCCPRFFFVAHGFFVVGCPRFFVVGCPRFFGCWLPTVFFVVGCPQYFCLPTFMFFVVVCPRLPFFFCCCCWLPPFFLLCLFAQVFLLLLLFAQFFCCCYCCWLLFFCCWPVFCCCCCLPFFWLWSLFARFFYCCYWPVFFCCCWPVFFVVDVDG